MTLTIEYGGMQVKLDYRDLGIRIRKRREELNIPQAELASRAGLSVQHISNVENAKSRVGLEKLVNIANALNCSVDQLLCGSLRVGKRDVYHDEIASIIEEFTDIEIQVLPEFLKNYNYVYKLLKNNIEKGK
ncbi:MAG: helix-turn-helix transcriptional regulator [Lachnospiraceae bacterium]|jgi:transcriptional regulator with XRE-family HTH domain|nr:hypothetical protein C819_02290 [Lachnospiraceae bacterium 10-1]MCX4350321.1 helix-turn-helix transcriptional regulator [Lachnospiraceae bacterium]